MKLLTYHFLCLQLSTLNMLKFLQFLQLFVVMNDLISTPDIKASDG